MGISTRMPFTPNGNGVDPLQLSGPSEVGYCWFDPGQNPVWASRLVVGFSSQADRDAFMAAAVSAFSGRNANYHYYVDSTGKVGAFNSDVVSLSEESDRSQANML
jgi:hypothetical protein